MVLVSNPCLFGATDLIWTFFPVLAVFMTSLFFFFFPPFFGRWMRIRCKSCWILRGQAGLVANRKTHFVTHSLRRNQFGRKIRHARAYFRLSRQLAALLRWAGGQGLFVWVFAGKADEIDAKSLAVSSRLLLLSWRRN